MAAPLVPVWRAVVHNSIHAGALHDVTVEVENAGSAPWRTRSPDAGLFLAYHWLDERGNPILWDGRRTPLEQVVEPGDTLRQTMSVRGAVPPGRYRFAVDLVEEHRFWVAELGNEPWEAEVDVVPRDAAAARIFGASPDDEWRAGASQLHAEGYTAVGGAVEGLREYPQGGGRHPRFPHPLVCPSLLPPLEPNCEVAGLPAWRADPSDDEPYMYDGRLVLRSNQVAGHG